MLTLSHYMISNESIVSMKKGMIMLSKPCYSSSKSQIGIAFGKENYQQTIIFNICHNFSFNSKVSKHICYSELSVSYCLYKVQLLGHLFIISNN